VADLWLCGGRVTHHVAGGCVDNSSAAISRDGVCIGELTN
jgi:hypothetical protein